MATFVRTFRRKRPRASAAALLLALAACTEPVTEVIPTRTPTADDAVYTAAGRYPAQRAGILIAQNAALQQGRALCEGQGRRFRPLGSIAGEDPETGEAIYAVRFRCLAVRATSAPLPSRAPDPSPSDGGQM
jgi:hypothetical protein